MKKLLLRLFVVGFLLGSIYAAGGVALATFNSTGGNTYNLKASISSTQTSITLTTFTEPVSGTPYTMSYINTSIGYGTINPEAVNSEFISFTGITQNANGSATLTGVSRGLARTPGTGGCVASSTLAQPFPGQTRFILSSPPCFFSQYPAKANNETITGQWTFSTFPITPASPAASETTAGISELAVGSEAAAGTQTGGTGFRLVLPTSIASSTFATSSSNVIPVTDSLNHIPGGFVASSTGLSVSGTFQASATTTLVATTTTIGAFPAWQIGKQLKVFTSPGTTTFSVPSGITAVQVQIVGGGASGGGASAGTGAGGGAAAYAFKNVNVTGTTSIQLVVGAGAAANGANVPGSNGVYSQFGPSTASFFMLANGGNGSGVGTGGSASGGDININGGRGYAGSPVSGVGGPGGSSFFGGDGAPGSGGAGCQSGSTCAGNPGHDGMVIVSW